MRTDSTGSTRPAPRRSVRDTVQILIGLSLFGVGLAFSVRGGYGQEPWTVFHDGLSRHTPLTIGTATVLTGAILVAVVLAMRVRLGLGTFLNVVIIGPAIDATLWVLDEPSSAVARAALTLAAPFVVAVGSGLYLGVHWGPGPRDGLMTGLNDRGLSIGRARFAIEVTAFVIGVVLGGTIGWGTVWWLVIIGPAVQWTLPRFDRQVLSPAAG